MKVLKQKQFKNGIVYALDVLDYPIETTDTFLPYYTKEANNNTNILRDDNIGDRSERWLVGVSVSSGCPVHCKFCATGQLKRYYPLNYLQIFEQVRFVVENNRDYIPNNCKEFKINYTRMGDTFLNLTNVQKAIHMVTENYSHKTHHYISTIGIKGSDFSWIKDNITLQLSLHSLDEKRRGELIPYKNLMSIEKLGKIRTKSKLKTTVNLTLVDEKDFDIEKLQRYFDPKYFFIKLSPINSNPISEKNCLGNGIIEGQNLI